jgi:hypothetical protein
MTPEEMFKLRDEAAQQYSSDAFLFRPVPHFERGFEAAYEIFNAEIERLEKRANSLAASYKLVSEDSIAYHEKAREWYRRMIAAEAKIDKLKTLYAVDDAPLYDIIEKAHFSGSMRKIAGSSQIVVIVDEIADAVEKALDEALKD